MPSIMFVCTANRYRSPIAAACFQKELTARRLDMGWHVSSAGTWTRDGLPAMPEALNRARRMGLNISQHTSRAITALLMKDADLVVVMEQGQKEALRTEFPAQARKVQLLSEVTTGMSYDIPDPILTSTEVDVPAEIADLLHAGFERICTSIGKK